MKSRCSTSPTCWPVRSSIRARARSASMPSWPTRGTVTPSGTFCAATSRACVRDRVAVTSLAMPARRRETTLTRAIYTYHPRFAGTPHVYEPGLEHLEGGDVLLLAPGVIAVGTGERTTPAGVERLARNVFAAKLAHTVLAVPIAQERATMHLDTVCTMVDVDAVVMYPKVADELTAIGPRLAVAYERNTETNARLEEAGIEVLRISGSELGSGRGGPRCMSCPVRRDPLLD